MKEGLNGPSQGKRFPEERLLLFLLRSDWEKADSVLQEGIFDFTKFQKLVKNSGTGSYIDWLIEKDGKQTLFPDNIMKSMRNARKKAKVDNAHILGILDKILDAAADRKIALILLKGSDLVHRVYASPELRHLDDVDLLIRRSDVEAFISLLGELDLKVPSKEELGYFMKASYNVECWTKSLFPCLFEVHWDLSQRFRYSVDMDAIWNEAERPEMLPENIFLLKKEHLFIHLCVHIFHHSFHPQLKWHIDVKELVGKETVDLDSVLGISSEWRCRRAVTYALVYIQKLFPDLFPEHVFREDLGSPVRDRFVSLYCSENPIRLFDSGGKKIAERIVRTLSIDRVRDMVLFSLNRIVRNPWVRFERD